MFVWFSVNTIWGCSLTIATFVMSRRFPVTTGMDATFQEGMKKAPVKGLESSRSSLWWRARWPAESSAARVRFAPEIGRAGMSPLRVGSAVTRWSARVGTYRRLPFVPLGCKLRRHIKAPRCCEHPGRRPNREGFDMKKLTAPALLIAIALAGCSAPQEAAQEPASVTASAASSARAATAPQARKMAAVPSRAAAEQKFLDLVDGAPEWPDIKRPTD